MHRARTLAGMLPGPGERLASTGSVRLPASRAPAADDRLIDDGFAILPGPFATATVANRAAWSLCQRSDRLSIPEHELPPLKLLGDFLIPSRNAEARDFQALHFDFGFPLDPRGASDVAHYTALYIALDHGPVEADTTLVRVDKLLCQRDWATPDELIRRFKHYGASHGAWDPQLGYSEGIFARLVEAADGREPELPSVSATPGFLCGTEFATADSERRFFAERGLLLEEAEMSVDLRPGELLVFDNLAFAHGRRGRRRPGELHQRIFGYDGLAANQQRAIRSELLQAFGSAL